MALDAQTFPGKVAKTGVATQHQRISAGAAASLGSLIPTTALVPTIPGGSVGEIRYPSCVTLQVETGAANTVYYTLDGSTPSATNGLVVPVAPAQLMLPYPDLLKNSGTVSATNQQIQLFAGGATNIQCLFEYW
jgi:hypothetical protein